MSRLVFLLWQRLLQNHPASQKINFIKICKKSNQSTNVLTNLTLENECVDLLENLANLLLTFLFPFGF